MFEACSKERLRKDLEQYEADPILDLCLIGSDLSGAVCGLGLERGFRVLPLGFDLPA